MTREQALQILRQHRAGLAARGIKSLAIFGSVARNEASSASDIDILVDFIGSATFDGYMETKFYLEESFGLPGRPGGAAGTQTAHATGC